MAKLSTGISRAATARKIDFWELRDCPINTITLSSFVAGPKLALNGNGSAVVSDKGCTPTRRSRNEKHIEM